MALASEPGLFHQNRNGDVQRTGQTDQRQQCDVVVAAFHPADIASVNLSEQREVLLRDRLCLPDST